MTLEENMEVILCSVRMIPENWSVVDIRLKDRVVKHLFHERISIRDLPRMGSNSTDARFHVNRSWKST
jgi:hypothetical protein